MIFDIHIHSCYSDGIGTPEEIIGYAKSIGLEGIGITDHNEIEGARIAMKFNSDNFKVIPGIEVSSIEGHILGLGITDIVERDLSAEETIEKIHKFGGIAIAAHPYDRLRHGVGDLIYELKFDAVEVYNGHTLLTSKNPKRLELNLKMPVTGGSDAHLLEEIGAVTMSLDNDPIESIINGNSKISVNISKYKILRNFIKRRVIRLRR